MAGKPAARVGDIGSGHACHFPPSPATSGSPDVNVNGIPAVRQGDPYAPHGCGPCPAPPHGRALASGSATVYINGKQAGRVGDPIDCGGAAAAGSPNVNIGQMRPSVPTVAAAGLNTTGFRSVSPLGDGECDKEAGRNE
ncbi:PAAR domain-containing protein [uncultured Litoreibacter sp.]|uniref:PAAR domain-containing protein n=1 Tax=uncultured Litoreibacter sp. TaxID=1392394 RepID=UPI0026231A1B|nr:PAAR domain-containing protein [uncultured Litoreibacter sp.]